MKKLELLKEIQKVIPDSYDVHLVMYGNEEININNDSLESQLEKVLDGQKYLSIDDSRGHENYYIAWY